MFARRTDLPLEGDGLGRYLPWLVAFMVFLSALALGGLMAIGDAVRHWDNEVSGTLTVQVPPAANAKDTDRRIQAALEILRALPGVHRADALAPAQIRSLLEPWLDAQALAELPLPRLIDVELETGADISAAEVARRLATAVPDAVVDDHRVWLTRLVELARSVEALVAVGLLLMAAATVGTVVFTTRTGLAIHRDVIEVLHLIGAQDGYIARQFASRAMMLGLRGGLMGLVLAVPALAGIGYLGRRLQAGFLPEMEMTALHWAAIVALPLVVAAIATVTARLTVVRTLARML